LFTDHPVGAIAAALVLSLTVGVLVYVALMRKMTGQMVLAAILTTIAIGILLRGVIVLIWSAAQQHPLQALKFSNPSIELIAGAGRGPGQPPRRAGRRGYRRQRRGLGHPLCRSVAVRRGPVPGAHRRPDRAPVGAVRHARGARPCLGPRAPAAISAPATTRTSRSCRRGSNARAWACSSPRCWRFR